MKNKIHFLFGFFLLATIYSSSGQCPVAGFILPDSACPGLPVYIDNSNSTAQSWNWDYNIGDLDSLPSVSGITGGGSLNFPEHMKIVNDNGNYYGFVPNASANYITRYDFGNSITNTPLITSLTADPVFNGFANSIEIVKSGTGWIGFVCMYSSGKLVRLQFDSLTQVSPVIMDLGNLNTFGPSVIKIIGDYMFITNQLSDISRYSFGGSYSNVPLPLLPNISTNDFNNAGIDIEWDCNSSKYIGYVGAYSSNELLKLDFGNSLGNMPVVTSAYSISKPQGIQLIKEGNNWNLFTVTENNRLFHFTFGSSLDNPIFYDYDNNLGGSFNDPKNIELVHSGTSWYGVVPNTLLFALRLLAFPDAGSLAVPYSTTQSPNNLIFPGSATGYHYLELTETDNNGFETLYYDSTLVTILPPIALFQTTSVCENNAVIFSDNSTVCFGNLTGWNWDFGDAGGSSLQNPQHIYSTAGNYPVSLTVYTSNGDSNTVITNLTVSAIPTADFIFTDSICAGIPITFTDNSTTASGIINNRTWNFGDNNSDSTGVTLHTYTEGNYIVTLTVISDAGCIDSISKPINIKVTPQSSFTISNSCLGDTAKFYNGSIISTGSIVGTDWNFGDNNTDNQVNPIHYYGLTASNYNVSLISTGTNGCMDTLVKPIRIGNKPTPWFSLNVDTLCAKNNVTFLDSSTIGTGDTITKRIWDFGDSSQDSVSINPVHSYQNPGNYTITLTTFSPSSCNASVSRNVFVIESPTANFITTNECFGKTINFNDSSVFPSGSVIASWNWNFGDSTNSLIQNPNHIYAAAGNYPVTLQIVSSKGCIDSIIKNVIVYPKPEAYFIFSKACSDSLVQFTDSSFADSSTITTWNWDFGITGSTSNLQNPTYNYLSASVYPVQLIAGTMYGCLDTITRLVAVDQSPGFTLNINNNCFGIISSFNFTLIGTGFNLLPEWTFGDGTFSNLNNPVHYYTIPGTYPVSMTLTDISDGCSSTKTYNMQVFPKPTAAFVTDSGCVNTNLNLSDISTIQNGSISSWDWKFGTHGSSQVQNPVLSLSAADSFAVKLIVTTGDGCKDSVSHDVKVYPLPLVDFTPSAFTGAAPLTLNFTNLSSPSNYTWNFGDGSIISNQISPQHVYNDTGNFIINLTAVTSNGCIDSTKRSIRLISAFNDLGIEGLSFTEKNGLWIISTNLRNYGTQEVSNFSLKAQLEGKSNIIEKIDKIIPAGQAQIIVLNSSYEVNKSDHPEYLCLTITDVKGSKDENISNDNKCITISNNFQLFEIYPNPATDYMNLNLNIPVKDMLSINFYDLNGRRVIPESNLGLSKGYNNVNVDTRQISAGIYIIEISYRENFVRRKIIKE